MKKVLWITGFKDIGRSNWPHSIQKTEYYLECFERISKIDNLICFTDKKTYPSITEKIKFPSKKIYDIDAIKDFYNEEAYKIENNILRNPNFISKIPEYLRSCMQYHDANINLITYTKHSLIRRASELYPDYTHYAWIDFGYAKFSNIIPPEKFLFENVPEDKVYVSTLLKPDFDENKNPICHIKQQDGTIQYFLYDWTSLENLISHPLRIIKGNLWFVPKGLTHWFENEMKKSVNKQYELGLVCGYEESLWLDIIAKYYNLFKLDLTDTWWSWDWI